MNSVIVRETVLSDFPLIQRLYPDAFPTEELRPLVRNLLQDTPNVLSLAAFTGSTLIGHVVLTPCSVTGGSDAVALLGPLAVATAWQKGGIGRTLVQTGLDRLRIVMFDRVFVLGDPVYYSRFGFEAERSVAPPFPLPEEWRDAWQSIALRGIAPKQRGTLNLPQAWNEPSLWLP